LEVNIPLLRSPAEAVEFLATMDRLISSIEADLEEHKRARRMVAVDLAPQLFDVADVVEVTLPSGLKAKKGLHIEGSLPKPGDKDPPEAVQEKLAKRDKALAWAQANGWGPFVKDTIVLEFDKGDSAAADKVVDFVRGFNSGQPKMKRDQGIHAQTLQSQARKRLEQGLDLPLEDLGLTALTQVKITKRPKEQ
jgi:hypothetical protein